MPEISKMLQHVASSWNRTSKLYSSRVFLLNSEKFHYKQYKSSSIRQYSSRESVQIRQKQFLVQTAPTFTFRQLYKVSTSWALLQKRCIATKERKCWKCGKDTNVEAEMFFCECGVIQEVDKLGYFQVLGMPEKFDVDLESLSQNYKNLQRQLHPDKHSLKPKREQDLAEQQSSYVVNAYQTIMKPLSRAMYLLEINGNPLEEENTSVDQDFLMQIMETNEEIIEADSSEDLRKIEEVNDQNIKECIQIISQAFGTNDIDLAKSWTIKLKYFCNIDGKLRETKQISFD